MLATSARRALVAAARHASPSVVSRRAAWPAFSRNMSVEAKSLVYETRGETITISEEVATLSAPSGNQALLKFLAAPITRADYDVIHASGESSLSLDIKEVSVRFAKAQEVGVLDKIAGVVGKLPSLPAVGGIQGVAQVEEVGSGVKGLKPGDWVLPPVGAGTWRSHALMSEDDLITVPNDIPMEYAAVLGVSPCAALRMLSDFETLSAGDVIVINAANGLVGQTLVQLAAARGIQVVAVMRGRQGYEEVCPHLITRGAAVVISENWSKDAHMKSLMAELPAPKMGFDGTGGNSGAAVANLLPAGATLVKFGSASGQPFRVASEKNLQIKTFFLSEWQAKASKSDKQAMVNTLADMVRDKSLQLLLERAFFDKYKTALKKGYGMMRDRQLVMCMAEPVLPTYPADLWQLQADEVRLGMKQAAE
mmetsp:Transcript_31355/g.73917  ORF Transcript_31355/g.73917 Transcript_31355/m.73917 type:complete len:423 (-) Transcript_31355:375-1643(-)